MLNAIKLYFKHNKQHIFYIIMINCMYMLEVVAKVLLPQIMIPQLFLMAIFTTAIVIQLPLLAICTLSLLYDLLLSGYVGVETLPILVSYYFLQLYHHHNIVRQSLIIITIIFLLFLLVYNIVQVAVISSFFVSMLSLNWSFIIMQFVITLCSYPFLHLFIVNIEHRVSHGL